MERGTTLLTRFAIMFCKDANGIVIVFVYMKDPNNNYICLGKMPAVLRSDPRVHLLDLVQSPL